MDVSFSTEFPVVGGFTVATCTFGTIAAGQSVASVSWRHNITRAVTSGGRISISTDIAAGRSTLEIDDVVASDAGEYTCRVNFQNPSLQRMESALLQIASRVKHSLTYITFFTASLIFRRKQTQ